MSAGTCAFHFCFKDSIGRVDFSVGHVRGMSYGIFVTIGIKLIGEFSFCLLCLYQYESSPKVVDSLKYFFAQSPDFISNFENQFYSYSLGLTLSSSFQLL